MQMRSFAHKYLTNLKLGVREVEGFIVCEETNLRPDGHRFRYHSIAELYLFAQSPLPDSNR